MESGSSQQAVEGEQEISEIVASAKENPGVGSQVVTRLVLTFFKGT